MKETDRAVGSDGPWFTRVRRWAAQIPNEDAIVWLDNQGNQAGCWKYGGLQLEALRIAAALTREPACRPGCRVILCFPPSADFVPAFIGCQLCEAVAVPLYPPGILDRDTSGVDRFLSLVKKAQATEILSVSSFRHTWAYRQLAGNDRLISLRWTFTDELRDIISDEEAHSFSTAAVTLEAPALIQFSSGSTREPKGCVISHKALLHNIYHNWYTCGLYSSAEKQSLYDLPVEEYSTFTERYQQRASETWGHRLRAFSWLPVTHDMGLVGMVCVPLFFGCTVFLMSPVDFVRVPELWLRGLSKYGCSLTAAPNFAYDLAVRKIPDSAVTGLRLDKLLACINGAEPLRQSTIDNFVRDFVQVYRPGEPHSAATKTKQIVGSGTPHGEVKVKIVDPDTCRELEEWQVGEVWVSSPSAALAYFSNPEETARTFNWHIATPRDGVAEESASFLRTGDLGFLGDNELFITGRLKDVIIIRGCMYHPQDIEEFVDRCEAVRKGSSVAFPVGAANEEEALGVAVELDKQSKGRTRLEDMAADVLQVVNKEFHLAVQSFWVVEAGSLPKTTSGKPRRSEARERLERGTCQGILFFYRPPGSDQSIASSSLCPLHNARAERVQSEPGEWSTVPAERTWQVDTPGNGGSNARAITGAAIPSHEGGTSESIARPAALPIMSTLTMCTPPDRGLHGSRTAKRSTSKANGVQASNWLATCVHRVLGTDVSVLTPETSLQSLGLDSITAIELAETIHQTCGVDVQPFRLFEFPDLRGLEAYCLKCSDNEDCSGAHLRGPRAPLAMPPRGARTIVVTGAACRLPGTCDSPEEFWRSLQNGVDCISAVPGDSWTSSLPCAHTLRKLYTLPSPLLSNRVGDEYSALREGGFIAGVDLFDNTFFGISDAEATAMDPQQRLLLMKTVEAFDSAGLDRRNSTPSPIMTVVGSCSADWQRVTLETRPESFSATSYPSCMLANRVSYTLALTGPSLSVDTACSSSLVALHCALRELQEPGAPIETAVVAGVNLMLFPDVTAALARGGFLSPSCRCRTFDDGADGYARSEGVVVLVLQAVNQIEPSGTGGTTKTGGPVLPVESEDGTSLSPSGIPRRQSLPHCRLLASSVVHGGKTGSLTSPSCSSQERLHLQTLAHARTHPHDICYIEMHGTGTRLGDPIEASAICSIFSADGAGDRKTRVLLGAVKTNLGHSEGASGLVGLLKAILCLHARQVPPNLHLKRLNKLIDFKQLPVTLPSKPMPLPEKGDLIALVTSLGFGGTYAQVAVQAPALLDKAASPLTRTSEIHWNSKSFGAGGCWKTGHSQQEPLFEPYLWTVDWEHLAELADSSRANQGAPLASGSKKWLILQPDDGPTSLIWPEAAPPGVRPVVRVLSKEATCDEIACFLTDQPWDVVVIPHGATVNSPESALDLLAGSVPIVQACSLVAMSSELPAVLFLTRGCLQVEPAKSFCSPPFGAVLLGLVRASRLEIESLSGRNVPFFLVDLDPKVSSCEAFAVLPKLLDTVENCQTDESDLAIRGLSVYVPRVRPQISLVQSKRSTCGELRTTPPSIAVESSSSCMGSKCLSVTEPLAPHECRVRLFAVCMEESFWHHSRTQAEYDSFPCSCSGVVIGVGSDVKHLLLGESVCGVSTGRESSVVTVPAALLQPIPASLSFEVAAVLPVQLALLRWALEKVPAMRPEATVSSWRLLVIKGGCGIGFTAACLFQAMGAELHAIVSTQEQRRALVESGVPEAATWCQQDGEVAGPLSAQIGAGKIDVIVGYDTKVLSCNSMLCLLKQGGTLLLPESPDCRLASKLSSRPDITCVRCSLDLALRPYNSVDFGSNLRRACEDIQLNGVLVDPVLHVFPYEAEFWDTYEEVAASTGSQSEERRNTHSRREQVSRVHSSTLTRCCDDAFKFVANSAYAGSIITRYLSALFPSQAADGETQKQFQPGVEAALSNVADRAAGLRERTFVVFEGSVKSGLPIVKWLIEEGALYIVVVDITGVGSEHGEPTFRQRAVLGHSTGRVHVTGTTCDMSRRDEIRKLFKAISDILKFPPVAGVFYNATQWTEGLLATQSFEAVSLLAAPSLLGSWLLHQVLSEEGLEAQLELFVFFSGVSGLFGGISQSIASAANAAVDALAFYRRSLGLSALSIEWAPWLQEADEVSAKVVRRWLEKGGIASVRDPLEALRVILVRRDELQPTVACFAMEQEILSASMASESGTSVAVHGARMRNEQRRAGVRSEAMVAFDGLSLARKDGILGGSSDALKVLFSLVRKEVLELAGYHIFSKDAVLPSDEPLVALGLDSLGAAEFRHDLQRRFRLQLDPSFFKEDTTVNSIAGFVAEELGDVIYKTAGGAPSVGVSTGSDPPDGIAVISMAVRLPGGCDSLEALWAMLLAGKDLDCSLSSSDTGGACSSGRLSAFRTTALDHRTKFRALLVEKDEFDHTFFGLSFKEAFHMEPCHRLMLEVAYESLYTVNIREDTSRVIGMPLAVFATSSPGVPSAQDVLSPVPLPGHQPTLSAHIISHHLNLTSASVTLPSGGLSSLVALSAACDYLRSDHNQCQAALVIAGHLAAPASSEPCLPTCARPVHGDEGDASGECCAGLSESEGIIAIVVQRLSRALENQNCPYAVLKSSVVIHKGRHRSDDQEQKCPFLREAMKAALATARIQPAGVTVLETGTAGLGPEALEMIETARSVFREGSEGVDSWAPLAIGNLRPSLGGLAGASGLASLAKLVLVLARGSLPPSIPLKGFQMLDKGSGALETSIFPRENMSLRVLRGDSAKINKGSRDMPVVGALTASGSDDTVACLIVEEWPCPIVPCGTAMDDAVASEENHTGVVGESETTRWGEINTSPALQADMHSAGPARTLWFFGEDLWILAQTARGVFFMDPSFCLLLDEISKVLAGKISAPLQKILFTTTESRAQEAEPAARSRQLEAFTLLGLQWAFAQYLRRQGEKPFAVMGVGLGEVAAAAVAGAFSLREAAELIEAILSRRAPDGKTAASVKRSHTTGQHRYLPENPGCHGLSRVEPVIPGGLQRTSGFTGTQRRISCCLPRSPAHSSGGVSRSPLAMTTSQISSAAHRRGSWPAADTAAHASAHGAVAGAHLLERLRPEVPPCGRVAGLARSISLRQAKCVYISTVTGRPATDSVLQVAAYWDPQAPKQQRVRAAFATAVQLKVKRIITICCAAASNVHLLLGLPPEVTQRVGFFSFTGRTCFPEGVVQVEAASSPRVATSRPSRGQTFSEAPCWKRFSFRAVDLCPTVDEIRLSFTKGDASIQHGDTGGPPPRLPADNSPEMLTPGLTSTNDTLTHVLHSERLFPKNALLKYSLEVCYVQEICAALEKAVSYFSLQVAREQYAGCVIAPWLVISAVRINSATLQHPRFFGFAEAPEAEKTPSKGNTATVRLDTTGRFMSLLVLRNDAGVEELASCEIPEVAGRHGKPPGLFSLSEALWRPALSVPVSWLFETDECSCTGRQQEASGSATATTVLSLQWRTNHLLCRIRVSPPRLELHPLTIVARLLKLTLEAAFAFFIPGAECDKLPEMGGLQQASRVLRLDELWLCPYVPITECWGIVRQKAPSAPGQDDLKLEVQLFNEAGTPFLAAQEVSLDEVGSPAVELRAMEVATRPARAE